MQTSVIGTPYFLKHGAFARLRSLEQEIPTRSGYLLGTIQSPGVSIGFVRAGSSSIEAVRTRMLSSVYPSSLQSVRGALCGSAVSTGASSALSVRWRVIAAFSAASMYAYSQYAPISPSRT